ncbi:MAG: co-chaperone DjlA [Gammaproteobacteria bacterium]|nr:co-chaperone DjlA [Gammaproteobacteria bacterium]
MKWMGKVAGGLLGALAMGPIGAALGVLFGHQYDEEPEPAPAALSAEEALALGRRFFRSTFRVMGALAKSDGRVTEAEIAAARAIMQELRLGPEQVREAIECFGAGKQPGFDLQAELEALAQACDARPQLLRMFFEIQVRAALAGNNLDGPVRILLLRSARTLGISAFEFAHLETVLRLQRGAFHGARAQAAPQSGATLEAAYRVLEVDPRASDAEVSKAYRRQLQRHHPDKLKANGLPESMLAYAQQRTQQIIEAWELIRARRGIR